MDHDFWLTRWQEGRIGFHQAEVDRHLVRWWPTLGLARGTKVLVPLCGKSLDLRWLAAQGHEVVGVELSPIACRAFFDEQGLEPEIREEGAFTAWRSGPITILQGDVFDLPDVPVADAAYDRAATVALPPALRERYARKLADLLPTGAPLLLVAFDDPDHPDQGPPFSVPEAEVARLFGEAFTVERLERGERASEGERLGRPALVTETWRLVRR